jgi:hypothetical protein
MNEYDNLTSEYDKLTSEYDNLTSEYVYLVREREFIITNKNIYKYGKTKQVGLSRIHTYPKASEIICFEKVHNCDLVENRIKELFKKKYIATEFGYESFFGNGEEMRKDIHKIIYEEEIEQLVELDKSNIKIQPNNEKTNQQIIQRFIDENVLKTDKNQDKIKKTDLKIRFDMWFQESQGSRKGPKSEELYQYMNKKFGPCRTTGWHCMKIVYQEEEDEFDLESL